MRTVERSGMDILHLCVLGLVGLHLNIGKPSYARSPDKARPDVPPHKIEVLHPKSSSILLSASLDASSD